MMNEIIKSNVTSEVISKQCNFSIFDFGFTQHSIEVIHQVYQMLFREIHHMVNLYLLGFLIHHCQVTIYFLSKIILHLSPVRLSFKTPMCSIPVYWLVAVVVTARSRSTPFQMLKKSAFSFYQQLGCTSCQSSLRVIYPVCHSNILVRCSKPYNKYLSCVQATVSL